MKKIIVLAVIILAIGLFFVSNINKADAAKPSDYGLKEGDLISAIFSDDPDVYIINDQGYKRLFLNPEIFKFYNHLGGFFNIKLVTKDVVNAFPTSGLFRDCESNDQKVYGVDISGEDVGQLHWVNTTGDQAVKDDPNFFKKVFCINNKEFSWYPKGNALVTVKDVPDYERMSTGVTTTPVETVTANSSLKDVGQVAICHYPLGNTSNAQTLIIDASALKAHLEHGDTVGMCTGTIPPLLHPTCLPRPACLDATPRCLLAEPIGGWCQAPVPSPTVVPVPTLTPAPGSITVVYPNGGEIFQKGTTQFIKWNSSNVSKVYIKLRKGTDTYSMPEGMITDNIPNVDGYYKWWIPTTLPDGSDYAVRIIDGNYTGGYDDSDKPFSIITTATQTPVPSATPIPSISAAPTPTPIASSTPTPTPTPIISAAPTPTPMPTTVATSAPTNVTFGWYKGFSGQPPIGTYQMAISFLYASNILDAQSFRLYLKKPGESSFSAVATFTNPSSINSVCSSYINSGDWRMRNCTSSGGGYWQIFSPSGPASSYSVGEYNAYLVAVNNSGVEGSVSSTAKNIVSKTSILGPIGAQTSLMPQFRWSVPSGWPGGYFWPQVNDSTTYVWSKPISSGVGITEGSATYDGPALSTSKTYYVNIWAEGNDSNGTRNFSMGESNPSFTVASAPTPTPTPTPTPISCAPITVSLSPTTPQLQNVTPGQSGVPLVIFNVAVNCNLTLNSFAVSLLPMPNGYQNISSLRLYNNTTGVQLGSTITASVAGLNFAGLNQPISANQTLSLKVVGDISPSAVIGSTVYGVFGGSYATDVTGTSVGNNASGNLIIGNTMTIVAPVAGLNQSNSLAVFSRNLTIGSIGNDVKQLQALLVNEVGYSADLITGYFGRITRDAVKKFQEKYGIQPTLGYFGEITRKALSALISN